jgi:hypothetical protein
MEDLPTNRSYQFLQVTDMVQHQAFTDAQAIYGSEIEIRHTMIAGTREPIRKGDQIALAFSDNARTALTVRRSGRSELRVEDSAGAIWSLTLLGEGDDTTTWSAQPS